MVAVSIVDEAGRPCGFRPVKVSDRLTKPDDRYVNGEQFEIEVARMRESGLRVEDSATQAGGFDFLYGNWEVRHSKLCERLQGCREWYEFPGTLRVAPILGGLGNFDHNGLADPAGAYEAHSLRLYSPADGQWSVWWLDPRNPGAGLGPPVVGQFKDGKAWLFGDDSLAGRPIKVRTTYEALDHQKARWTQAFREDSGLWEINWVMDFRRITE